MSGPMALSAAQILCDVHDLGLLVWREARGASWNAQIAVARSVRNRVARPSWWGHTQDEVIWKKWQYSSLTAPGDPQLLLQPKLSDASWLACLGVAYDVLHGDAPNPFPGADSYYDDSIAPPGWTKGARFCGKMGKLNFYDVDLDYETTAIVAGVPGASSFDAKLLAFLRG